jgi:hypothetical protein
MPTVHSITLSGKDLSQLKLLWQEYEASAWLRTTKQEVVYCN